MQDAYFCLHGGWVGEWVKANAYISKFFEIAIPFNISRETFLIISQPCLNFRANALYEQFNFSPQLHFFILVNFQQRQE